MYKLCKTEQSMARQRELEQGLLEAMLNQQYDEISVSDLCDRMNIPRKSFYRYFSGKQGALYALLDHTILDYESYSALDNSREIMTHQKELESYFAFWKKQEKLLHALTKNRLEGYLVMRNVEHAVVDLACPNRVMIQDSAEAKAHAMTFAVCGLMAMVLRWYQSGFAMSVKELAEIGESIVTKPLFNPNFTV